MKNLSIGIIIVSAFLLITGGSASKVSATGGHSNDNVPGNECLEGIHLYNPHCTATPHPSASQTPQETPYESSPSPSTSQEASSSPLPSSTPTSTNSPDPSSQNTEVIRTDLSDGRSDGRGCGSYDCSTQQTLSKEQTLPSTGGGGIDFNQTIIAVFLAVIGWRMKSYAKN